MAVTWNPWHGCHKFSAGCQNCYVYRIDQQHGKDSSVVQKTASFRLPVQKNRAGAYKVPSGETVYTCFSSDFFVEEADAWRKEAWDMMRARSDLSFFFITKRIHRFSETLPPDWGDGYGNVTVGCTVENRKEAAYRLPIFLAAPIRHRVIIAEPLLESLILTPYLSQSVENVIVGGESGEHARLCDFDWVLDIRNQCREAGVPFFFKQTGAKFKKDGKIYRIPRKDQQKQARKADINMES